MSVNIEIRMTRIEGIAWPHRGEFEAVKSYPLIGVGRPLCYHEPRSRNDHRVDDPTMAYAPLGDCRSARSGTCLCLR